MDETTFWQMIEQAKADSGGDGEEQVNLLTERLSMLEVSEIVEYAFLFDTFHARAYRCDIWDAAYIANGGCSDDGFMDFRAWLIAQGQHSYEQVLADPDWLAQVAVVIEDKWGRHTKIQLEKMNYVAMHAYEMKTGNDYNNMPYIPIEIADIDDDWTPKAEWHLKYPQLWARFGRDWEE